MQTLVIRLTINVVELVTTVLLAILYWQGAWRFADVLAWLSAH